MPVARPESSETRVIAHLDLDCFYVQVEQRKRPELRGKPAAVVQYNPWKGGGLIAVSYEARRSGVTRNMRGDDAKKVCPDIELVQVPMAHGHAFLSPYRDAGSEVVAVLSRGGVCERASIDEVYLDITEAAAARLLNGPPLAVESLSEEACKTHVLGLQEDGEEAMTSGEWICRRNALRDDQLLACGALIVAELRTAVLAETQFTCSAGIAHNKNLHVGRLPLKTVKMFSGLDDGQMLAKLTSSMHKPAQQTVIPSSFVPTLLTSLPLKKIGQLGGKLGKSLEEDLGVKTPGDLLPFSELKLQELYGINTGIWLWNIARGKNGDEVRARVLPKSHSCGKTFAGPQALKDMTSVMHWLGEMCGELQERLDTDLEMNNRTARLLGFHAACQLRGGGQPAKKFPSKSCPLRYGKDKILSDARILFERGLRDFCPPNQSLSPVKGDGSNTCNWAVTGLSIGASGISTIPSGVNPITSFFAAPLRSSSPVAKSSSSASPTTSPSRTFGSFTDVDFQQRLADVAGTCQSSEALVEGSGSLKSLSSGHEEINGCIQRFKALRDPEKEESGCMVACNNSEEISCCRNLLGSLDTEGNSDQQNETPLSTPTFGRLGDPVPPLGNFKIRDGESADYPGKGTADANNASVFQSELLEATIIRCSPVEGTILASHNGHSGRQVEEESSVCVDESSSMEMDRKEAADIPGGSTRNLNYERPEPRHHAKMEGDAKLKATRSLQPRLSFPHSNRPRVFGSSGAGDPASKEQQSFAGRETGAMIPEHNLSSTEQDPMYEAGGVPVDNHLFVDGSMQMDRSGRASFLEVDARDVDSLANSYAGQKESRIVQSCLSFSQSSAHQTSQSPPGPSDASVEGMHSGTSKMTGVAKLKDFWQRNTVTQTQSSKRTQSHWEYKQDEIDEEVLSQLPLEIQKELRESWKVHRARPAKRPSISDFFPSFK